MARRLFTLLSALSLLLCVAVCVLWVRSYRTEEAICYGSSASGRCYLLMSDRGQVAIEATETRAREFGLLSQYEKGLWSYSLDGHSVEEAWRNSYYPAVVREQWGFAHAIGERRLAYPEPEAYEMWLKVKAQGVAAPYWCVLLVLLIGPTALAWRYPTAATHGIRTLLHLRLRPPRHPRPLPRVRNRPRGEGGVTCRPAAARPLRRARGPDPPPRPCAAARAV